MRSIQLSPRLQFIADLVNPTDHLADIGTDHGYLPYCLLNDGKIAHASLCDINEGPLNNARQTFKNSSYEMQISYKLGSGLSVLMPGEANSAVIAGMGGSLIQSLLKDAQDVFEGMSQVILQPMTEQAELRRWLLEIGQTDLQDYYVKEGNKLYEIIVLKPLKNALQKNKTDMITPEGKKMFAEVYQTSHDLEFGYRISLSTRDTYNRLLEMKQKKYEKILRATISLPDTDTRRIMCFKKLETIETIKTYTTAL